jgi:hypothetical protein
MTGIEAKLVHAIQVLCLCLKLEIGRIMLLSADIEALTVHWANASPMSNLALCELEMLGQKFYTKRVKTGMSL